MPASQSAQVMNANIKEVVNAALDKKAEPAKPATTGAV